MKKASVRDTELQADQENTATINADIESIRFAQLQRHHEDLDENRAAERRTPLRHLKGVGRHWNDHDAVRLAKCMRYTRPQYTSGVATVGPGRA